MNIFLFFKPVSNKTGVCLALILSLMTSNSFSQQLHSFLFCKTDDSEIGVSAKINYVNMQEELKNIALGLHYGYAEHQLIGPRFNKDSVLKYLDTIDIKPNDIILLYFSTHGGKSKWDKNIFPQIDVPDTLISVYNLYRKILLNKHPKSTITLIEACSGFRNLTPQETFIYQSIAPERRFYRKSKKNININNSQSFKEENLQKLFSGNYNIIISAGQPGKETIATTSGSIFTNCFLRTINEYLLTTDIEMVNWDNLLFQCQQYTSAESSSISRSPYYPVWEKRIQNPQIDIDSLTKVTTVDTLLVLYNSGLKISCSATFKGYNPYFVYLEIIGKPSERKSIKKVVYFLHKTMPDSIVTVKKARNDFGYGFSVWGDFPIKAKVYYKNGRIVDLYGDINLENIKPRLSNQRQDQVQELKHHRRRKFWIIRY